MGLTVTLDRMIHTAAAHHQLSREMGLSECAASGGPEDLNPIDLIGISMASCLLLVMARAARKKGIDLTGTWAEASCDLNDYKLRSISVHIHSPNCPSDDERAYLQSESHECPVYLAMKGNVKIDVAFEWDTQARPTPYAAQARCSAQT